MTRKFSFAEEEYYHLYNRGVEKRIIFLDKIDYERFLTLLNVANSNEPVHIQKIKGQGLILTSNDSPLIDIGSYCLMPNHFHMLVRGKIDGGVSKFMSKIMTAYTMYFNKRYNRTGSLFQGTFKAEHADSDNYLKYLFSYIHLNPVKLIQSDWKEKGIDNIGGAKKYLNDYRYSSFIDYMGVKREENNILNIKAFPEYFESKEDFENNVFDWLDFNPDLLKIEV